jgi:hypothetical protein
LDESLSSEATSSDGSIVSERNLSLKDLCISDSEDEKS